MKKLSLQIISFLLHMMPLSLSLMLVMKFDEIWWNCDFWKKERKEKEEREMVVQP
jgi:hypothetical protein